MRLEEQNRFMYMCMRTYVNLNFMDIVEKNKKYYNSNIQLSFQDRLYQSYSNSSQSKACIYIVLEKCC